MERIWTGEQNEIYKWFAKDFTCRIDVNGNLVIIAYAGTGKTTTIVEGINRAPDQRILGCAFNKSIATEFQSRLRNPRAVSKTFHAVGFGAVGKFWSGIGVDTSGKRADGLTEKVCGPTAPDTIKKLVTQLATKGREMMADARVLGDLTDIAVQFDLQPEEQWEEIGFDLNYVEQKALDAMELAATVKPVQTGIDYSDMIYLPVRNGWLFPVYDLVVVDETQDMNATQLAIAKRICRGRFCAVGDPNQAIYTFRGADSGSIGRIKEEMNAGQLGLTTTYRCAKSIVSLAQRFVPDFNAYEGNPEGVISDIGLDKLVAAAGPGDFVLSRMNAPLVSVAMSLLRNGKRARVAGKDIGTGLQTLVRKMKARSIPDFLTKIANWGIKQSNRAIASGKPELCEGINDKVAMLTTIAEEAKSIDELVSRIANLFQDDGLGRAGVVTCSSVHRSKGLEAERVFILKSTLRDWDQEELNIQYVAITRAKNELVWVF